MGERFDPAFNCLRRQSAPPAGPQPRVSWWRRVKVLALPVAAAVIASSLLWAMTTETSWYYGGPGSADAAARAGGAAGGWRAKGVLVTRAEFAWLLAKHGLLISFLAWLALTGRGARFRDRLAEKMKARPAVQGWRAKLPERFRDRFRLRAAYVAVASFSYCVYAFAFDLILYTGKTYFALTHERFAPWALRHLLEGAADFSLLFGAGFVFYFLTSLFYRHWLWLAGLVIPLLLFFALQFMPDLKHYFNPKTPLRDKRKEELVLGFAADAGVEVDVKEIDASRRSKALNATSTGNLPDPPAKPRVKITYTDTLLDGFTDAELLFATGHEIGHHALGANDEAKDLRTTVVVCWIVVGFFVAGRGCKALIGRCQSRLGFDDINDPASVPLVALAAGVLCFAYVPAGNAMTLYQERYADWGAARLTVRDEKSREAAASVFEKLGAASPWDPDPPLLLHLLLNGHPATDERIRFVKSFDPLRAGDRPPRHPLLQRLDRWALWLERHLA